jgi:poly-gamma-glutamate capsule biosynthesis protein CapA/YwtB (metallophosphatase superfamily)
MSAGTDPSSRVSRIRLSAVGDVMLGRDVGAHYATTPGDFAMPDVAAFLAGSDIVIANLETPVAAGGTPEPTQDPQVTFRAAPAALQVLKGLGVNVVALGNNHALDYGEEGLIETMANLDAAGIRRVGAGRNYEEANAPLLLDVRGRRMSILSHSFVYSANTRMATRTRPGVADHRIDRIVPRIRALRAQGRDVIVAAHWGFEYRFYPLPYQMRQARQMIDAGAQLVLGHGPHYPQGIEEYRGREIVYSLGNFIFDEPYRCARRSFIYDVVIEADGTIGDRRLAPVHLPHHVPYLLHGVEGVRLLTLVARLGSRYGHMRRAFWQRHNAAYLTELGGRVLRTRSLKYLRVPPMSFYRDVGPSGLVRTIWRAASIAAGAVARRPERNEGGRRQY